MRAAIVCLLLSAVAISADLQSDIEDVASHLPIKEIESIGKEYVATYPEYADGLRFVQETTYEKLIEDFLQTEDGQKFIDYFNQRGIDIEHIWVNMSKMMGVMVDKWLEPKEEGENVGPAISGDIMADYRKALVESGFFDVVHNKIESSPEFANLVAAFKDPEFLSIFYHVANSKGLGNAKSPEVRGLWISAVAVSSDLQSDIEDVASHLPIKEIESIGKEYVATYPGYADGLRFVQETTYEKLIEDFLQTEDGQKFIDYFNQRGIDIEHIWVNMSKMMGVMVDKWLEPKEEGENVGPAISGDIMADYRKALVASGFFDVVHNKIESSPEFANLVAAFKDPEFHSIFYHVANSKGLGNAKSPEVRGLWKKVWKATQVVAIGSAILG